MNIFSSSRARGFTLVEIIAVVAIIGILASVVYASFGDARKKARDTQRIADLQTLQLALKLYRERHGTYQVPAGWDRDGNGSSDGIGWVSLTDAGAGYSKSITQELYDEGLLSSATFNDPMDGDRGYLLFLCNGGLSYSITAKKEIPIATEEAAVANVCNGAEISTTPAWGRNYAVSG